MIAPTACLSKCTLHGNRSVHLACRLCVTRHAQTPSGADVTGPPSRARVGSARGLTEAERFWSKVDKGDSSGCWVWMAAKSDGYGAFQVKRRVQAHRWSWQQANGPIPSDLQIDHLCRIRACVNPAHMELVTSKENTLRGESPMAQNARKTTCPKGHPLVHRTGQRRCLTCSAESTRRRYWRAKAGQTKGLEAG